MTLLSPGWYSMTLSSTYGESGANTTTNGVGLIRTMLNPDLTPHTAMIKAAANNGITGAGFDVNGQLYTWGSDNNTGMLGDGIAHIAGTANARLTVTPVTGVTNAIDVCLALEDVYWLASDGTVHYLGADILGGASPHLTPTQISGLTNIVRIACGFTNILALDNTGNLWFVGDNTWAQAGNGVHGGFVSTPFNMISNVTDFAMSETHAVAVSGGSVYCWGQNNNGSIGNGLNTGYQTTPFLVSAATNPFRVHADDDPTTLVLTTDSKVWFWGANFEAEDGLGASSPQTEVTTPTLVQNLPVGVTFTEFYRSSQSFGDCFMLSSDLNLWAWGANWKKGKSASVADSSLLVPTQTYPSSIGNVVTMAISAENGWYIKVGAPVVTQPNYVTIF